jgi:hypothetical protein
MKQVIQITVLVVEVGGLLFAVKLGHDGLFTAALRVLVFDAIALILFVLTHRLIEEILNRHTRRNNGRWWL